MGKRGRPKKPDSKNKGLYMRMSSEEIANLNYLSDKTGKKKAEILRESLKMYYNLQAYKD